MTYIHLLFDDHQIIRIEGAQTEILHPGMFALSYTDQQARADVLELFPQHEILSGQPLAAYPLKRHEARLVA